MTPLRCGPSRRGVRSAPPAAVLAIGLLAAGCATASGGVGAPAAAPTSASESAGVAPSEPAAAPAVDAKPVRIRIPTIGVNSRLEVLDVLESGEMEAPSSPKRAGWYGGGPVPGEIGPAVIAGHLDSRTGPAVFYRLPGLRSGDEVLVERSDGSTVRFVVQSVRTFPKDGFPTEDVYGATPEPVLRLITCGGVYDDGIGYRDNIIVFAVPEP